MFSTKVAILLVGLAALSSAKFCPRESRDGFQCRAKKEQFKCGIFFEDLLGGNELKWIGALPDAIRKARRKNPDLVKTIFPKVNRQPVKERYFETWSETCKASEANDKCYLLMNQIADDPLDSCKKTVGNLDGTNTIGDVLCGQARRFLSADNQNITKGLKNQKLSFFSSICTKKWNPVSSEVDGKLEVEEMLCCDSTWKFYRCDGGDFNKGCE